MVCARDTLSGWRPSEQSAFSLRYRGYLYRPAVDHRGDGAVSGARLMHGEPCGFEGLFRLLPGRAAGDIHVVTLSRPNIESRTKPPTSHASMPAPSKTSKAVWAQAGIVKSVVLGVVRMIQNLVHKKEARYCYSVSLF